MDIIHGITHPKPLIQKKVNYFADYYSLVVRQMGKNQEFEIDNILSLIEKMVYQFEKNKIKPKDKVKYIHSYLTNPLLATDNKYFQEYIPHHSVMSQLFDSYRKNGKLSDKDEKNFISKLNSFRLYLKKQMFDKALKSIISYLRCSHDVSEHKADMQHYTKLIAVELFFQRKGKADIGEVFGKIMTNDITEFPFCPTFIKDNVNNIKEAKLKFIANRTFDQQFEGIKNFRNQQAESKYYIFRVGNVKSDSNIDFELGDVTFYTSGTKKIKSLKKRFDDERKEYMTPFFMEQFQLFAIVSHSSKNVNNHHLEALNKANIAVQTINKECYLSCFIDKHSYLYTSDFKNIGGNLRMGPIERHLGKTSISKINNSDVHQYLKSKRLRSKKHFLSHESTHSAAKNSGQVDDYWKYAENIIGKPFKNIFVGLASELLIELEKQHIEIHIKNCFDRLNSDPSFLGMTFDEQQKISYDLYTVENYDYNLIKAKTTNEFIKDLVDFYYTIGAKSNVAYLKRFIEEVYEQRNFIIHDGKHQEKAVLKLNECVSLIFFAFRRKLLDAMIANPKKSFSEIKHDLEQKFQQLN